VSSTWPTWTSSARLDKQRAEVRQFVYAAKDAQSGRQ